MHALRVGLHEHRIIWEHGMIERQHVKHINVMRAYIISFLPTVCSELLPLSIHHSTIFKAFIAACGMRFSIVVRAISYSDGLAYIEPSICSGCGLLIRLLKANNEPMCPDCNLVKITLNIFRFIYL